MRQPLPSLGGLKSCRIRARPQPDESNRDPDAPQPQALVHAEKPLDQRDRQRHHGDEDAGHEELIHRSPNEMTEKGNDELANAKAQIAALCLPTNVGRRAATRSAARSMYPASHGRRPHTGESSCTDNLIKKYGRPQMMPAPRKLPMLANPLIAPSSVELQLMLCRNAIRDGLGSALNVLGGLHPVTP